MIGVLASSLSPPKLATLLTIINLAKATCLATQGGPHADAPAPSPGSGPRVEHVVEPLADVLFPTKSAVMDGLRDDMPEAELQQHLAAAREERRRREHVVAMLIAHLPLVD